MQALTVAVYIQALTVAAYIHALTVAAYIHALTIAVHIHALTVAPYIHALTVAVHIQALTVAVLYTGTDRCCVIYRRCPKLDCVHAVLCVHCIFALHDLAAWQPALRCLIWLHGMHCSPVECDDACELSSSGGAITH